MGVPPDRSVAEYQNDPLQSLKPRVWGTSRGPLIPAPNQSSFLKQKVLGELDLPSHCRDDLECTAKMECVVYRDPKKVCVCVRVFLKIKADYCF